MDLGLLQRQVAAEIGVSSATLLLWEKGRARPEIRHWPRIIRFLGYDPQPRPASVPEVLQAVRRLRGWSQKQLARALGVDPSTVRRWELGKGQPQRYLGSRSDELVEALELSQVLSAQPQPRDTGLG